VRIAVQCGAELQKQLKPILRNIDKLVFDKLGNQSINRITHTNGGESGPRSAPYDPTTVPF